jgi:hypothetical protein
MKKQKLEYSFESPLVHLVEVSLNHDSTVTGTATVLTSPGSLKELLRFENKVDRAKNDEQFSTANNDQRHHHKKSIEANHYHIIYHLLYRLKFSDSNKVRSKASNQWHIQMFSVQSWM